MADYPITGDRDEEEFRRDERVVLAAQLMDPANRVPPLVPVCDGLPAWIRKRLRHERTSRG